MQEDVKAVQLDVAQAEAFLKEGRDPLTGRQIVGKVPIANVQPFIEALAAMFPLRDARGVSDPFSAPDEGGIPGSVYLTVEPPITRDQAASWFAKMREVAGNIPEVRLKNKDASVVS